jgi:signal transduction histidine kinase
MFSGDGDRRSSSRGYAIARRRFRRLFYIGTGLLLVVTLGSIMIPVYVQTQTARTATLEELSASIVDQKRVLLETVIVEKIGDIERIRERLETERPPLSIDEFDQRFRAEVRRLIHTTELPDNGYIWINEIVDYEGGDDYAIRFAHPNLIDTEGDYLSTNTTDIAGNQPYLEELNGIKAEGEIYFDYYFQEMRSEQISHKLSFAKLYQPFDWVVATGVYLNDVDRLIETETARIFSASNRALRNGIIGIALGVVVLVFMTIFFETRIRLLIDSYVETEQLIGAQLLGETKKLEESNSQKDRLFSIIAHDLRNPIHALSSGLRMLDESVVTDHDDYRRTLMTELTTSAEGVSSLLDQLLEWSRSQRMTNAFRPDRVNLYLSVERACHGLVSMAHQKRIALLNLCERETEVYADDRMLETIVRNLISNAVKFTPEGGNVTVRSRAFANGVEVSVADNGVGIPESVRDTLFSIDSRYRTEGTNGEKGTGFGLDICYEFVRRHGGDLRVESTVGEGSTFYLFLPSA